MSEHWVLISNAGRRQEPRPQDTTLLHEDRLALWVIFPHELVFREDKLSSLHTNFLFTFPCVHMVLLL